MTRTSFSVLRGAVTPRVLPPTIDLVRVNSRLTTFGLLGGTVIGGGIAAASEWGFNLFQMPGALYVVVAATVAKSRRILTVEFKAIYLLPHVRGQARDRLLLYLESLGLFLHHRAHLL